MQKSHPVMIELNRGRLTPPVALMLAVIAVRLAYVLVFHFGFDIEIAGDYYDDIAHNLIAGNGYVIAPGDSPNLFRYPGYTYFLALLFALSNESYNFVVAVQLLLDIATLGLLYLIAREVLGRNTAILTAMIAALYPFSALYVLRYATEPLFTFLLAGAILVLTRGFVYGGITRFAVAGGLLGAAILCRASLFYFVALLPFIAFFISTSPQRLVRVRAAIVTTIVAIILIVPWGLRNFEVTGEFNLLGTAGGYSLWVGNFLPLDGRDRDELPPELEEVFLEHERRTAGDEELFSPAGEKRFIQATIQGWIDEPVASTWLIVRKTFRFWFSIYQPQYRLYSAILIVIQSVLLVFAAFGMTRGLWERRHQWHIIALVLYFNALHAVVIATFRYSLPVMPYVMMFAAHGMLTLPFLKSLFRPSYSKA